MRRDPHRCLEHLGVGEQPRLLPGRCDELQAHRETGRGEPARQRDHRAAGEADAEGDCDPVDVGLRPGAVDAGGVGPLDGEGIERSRRADEQVVVREVVGDVVEEPSAAPLGVDAIGRFGREVVSRRLCN